PRFLSLIVLREVITNLMLAFFMLLENLPGSLQNLCRQSGQTGYLNPVALVRAAWFDLAEENDILRRLFHSHMIVLHPRKELSQFGHLVVMSCKESLGPGAMVQVFDD